MLLVIFNIKTGLIFRYIGVHQTPIPKIPILVKKYLDSFIITVLAKDIFYAMITKMGLTAGPKSEKYISNESHEILHTYS